jgi:hypothetical protein
MKRGSKLSVVLVSVFLLLYGLNSLQHAVAACPAVTSTLGTATATVNVTNAGTYKVWSRIMAPDTTNNSYTLQVDSAASGLCGVVVGDTASIPANTWTWVDYRDANTASKVTLSLSTGNHTIEMIGREDGVKLDRVILVSDLTCIPTGTGDNCAGSQDAVVPTVNITAPALNATVSGATVTTSATATDNGTVSKVEFFIDAEVNPRVSLTNSPGNSYSYTLDTTALSNGTHTLKVVATDNALNSGQATRTFTVSNTVTPPPTPPPTPKPGDVNGDSTINALDLSILLSHWSQSGARSVGDLSGDGVINALDLSILLSNWGK